MAPLTLLGMSRFVTSRFIAVVIALVASLAAPASAMAHGLAHHELAEQHALSLSTPVASSVSSASEISSSERESTHGHSQIAAGIVLRWSAPGPALLADIVVIRSAMGTTQASPVWTPRMLFVPRAVASSPSPTRAPPSR